MWIGNPAFLGIHVITAHGVHIWCWAPYPTCVLLASFPDNPAVLQRFVVLRLKCLHVKKKNGWSTLRVPPAACHCCAGLASCLLRGLAVLSTTIVPGPESHIFLSSPGCMWAGVSWVPGHLYSLVLWHLSCFGTVTLAVWSQVPKPFLTPSETWEFV